MRMSSVPSTPKVEKRKKKKTTTTTTTTRRSESKRNKKETTGSGYATPIATYFTSDEGSRHAATTTPEDENTTKKTDAGTARRSPVSMQKWMKEALKAPVKVGQKMKFDMEETPPNIGDTNTNGNKDGSSFASPKKMSSMNNNKSNNSNAVTPNGDDRGLTTPRFKNMTPRDIFSSLRTTPI